MRKRKILIISSRNPSHSAGLGRDIWRALEGGGYEVHFLSKYKEKKYSDSFIGIFDKSLYMRIKNILSSLGFLKHLAKIKYKVKKYIKGNATPYIESNGIMMMYPDERYPDVPTEKILEHVKEAYDAVITVFWQDMINSSSLKDIYRSLKCPVFVLSPDMAPLTGGCYYCGDCDGYTRECRDCPVRGVISSDWTPHDNFIVKRNNYSGSECYFLGNTWMNAYAYRSGIFPDDKIIHTELVIDEDRFVPGNKKELRALYGLKESDFVLLIRSSEEPRKGNKFIAEAINAFWGKKEISGKESIKVITIGSDFFKNTFKLECDVVNMGFVSSDTLIKLYQLADVFVNGSYDDAGPSMINQSIMCGTPVVAFKTGCALDVVIDGESGYSVEIGRYLDMADAISKIHDMTKEQYASLSCSSRRVALRHNSAEVFVKVIDNLLGNKEK